MNKNATPFKWQGKNRDRGAGAIILRRLPLLTCFVCGFVFRFLKLLFYAKQHCFALRETHYIHSQPFFLLLSILNAFLVILEAQIFTIFQGSVPLDPLETSRLQRLGYCAPKLKLSPRSLKKSCQITSYNKSRTLAIPEVSVVLQNNPWIVPFLSNSYLGQESKYIFRMSCQAPSSIGHGRFRYFRDSTTRK